MIYNTTYKEIKGQFKTREGTNDIGVINEVWKQCYYFSHLSDLRVDDLVIDIGGHIGSFAILAGLMGAKVHVYEPDKDNFEILCENIKLNDLEKNIFPYNKAVYSHDGKGYMLLHPLVPSCHIVTEKNYKGKNLVSIDLVAFDNILKQHHHIDFLKLDCERSEFPILMGTNLQKVRTISMEWHCFVRAMRLEAFLVKEGFTICRFESTGGEFGKIQASRL